MCSALYCVTLHHIPSANLAACWYGDALQMRITQSISLSNIQTFSFVAEKARPEAVQTCQPVSKDRPACFLIGVSILEIQNRWRRSGNIE